MDASNRCCPLLLLPLDLLTEIAEYLPLRPRFVVATRLCKRLQLAVYASVRSYSSNYVLAQLHRINPQLLARLPNLTSLQLLGNLVEISAWPSFARLRSLDVFDLEKVSVEDFARFSSLTSLSFAGSSRAERIFDSLKSHSSSLTVLRMHGLMVGAPDQALHFPSLQELAVTRAPQALLFVDLERAPLTALRCLCDSAQLLMGHSWPKLRSLSVSLNNAELAPLSPFLGWLRSLTQLTALGLTADTFPSPALLEAEDELLEVLRHTALTSLALHPALASSETLTACIQRARISSMMSYQPYIAHEPLLQVLGPHLQSLTISGIAGQVNLQHIAKYVTALEELNIHLSTHGQWLGPRWALPRLKRMKLIISVFDLRSQAEYLAIPATAETVIQCYPSLRQVTFACFGIFDVEPAVQSALLAAWEHLFEWLHRSQRSVEVFFNTRGERCVTELSRKYPWAAVSQQA